MVQDFFLKFVKKEQVSKDAYTFYFDRSQIGLDFLPGQFIKMTLPIDDPERGNIRYFTVSSSPLNKQFLTITTRIIQSAFKKALFLLNVGALVKFYGPSGNFVFDEKKLENRIFLAGGIGVTPFHSMVSYAAERKVPININLFASFSIVEDFVFYDEFREISQDNSKIKIIYTVTKPEDQPLAEKWTGETGRIGPEMIKKNTSDYLNSSYWIAGPPGIVSSLAEIVREMGISSESIHVESFTGY